MCNFKKLTKEIHHNQFFPATNNNLAPNLHIEIDNISGKVGPFCDNAALSPVVLLSGYYDCPVYYILKKDYSKCICPSEFLQNLKPLKKECPLGPNCQFGLDHVSPEPNKQPDLAKCNCFIQCTCEAQVMCLQKVDGIVAEPKYTNCFANEEMELQSCCIRSICNDQKKDMLANLLPLALRNNIKMDAHKIMTEEMMKKECDEIKQILNENQNNKSIEHEKLGIKHKKSTVDFDITHENKERESTKKLTKSSSEEGKRSTKESVKSTKKASLKPDSSKQDNHNYKEAVHQSSTNKTVEKKEKTRQKKLKLIKHYKIKAKSTNYNQQATKKAPHIRYYYSGDTEHYKVKLGHKMCLYKPPLVPKHMGWLWNIEDLSKGIRERKGWPPGFIGSNIMELMTHYKSDTVSEDKLYERSRKWTSQYITPEYKKPKEEPPLLHIVKKGRTYNITFCPKGSDEDIGPIPIPLQITEKKHDSDTESSDSTLEFEFHSPKPQLRLHEPLMVLDNDNKEASISALDLGPNPEPKRTGSKLKRKKSRIIQDNKISWEEQETQIQNVT